MHEQSTNARLLPCWPRLAWPDFGGHVLEVLKRMPTTIALAVFSSDALSSTAYRDRRRGAPRDRDRFLHVGATAPVG
jgi:hypothetical protein